MIDLSAPHLAFAADVLDDLERTRIANQNRLRQLTRDEIDADGEDRGYGLTEDHPDVVRMGRIVQGLAEVEKDATTNLERAMRVHPMGGWAKAQRGVGAKQIGRLLAAVGDPYMRPELSMTDGTVQPARPRRVSELWALCGYVPFQRRQRGVKANWNDKAKMRAYMIVESTVKQLVKPCHVVQGEKGEYVRAVHVEGCSCSPYRRRYDEGRAKYAGSVHPRDCVRCGPTGKPALAGTPRSAKHIHQMAVRLATKDLLKDLWIEARRLHDLHGDQATSDTQGGSVAV